jgi:hypothetical protein
MERIRNDYLARLEEMFEDLRTRTGKEIYPEASQHAEDGSLVLGEEDELPRRIDAVTADGDEYNLEVGDPVPPEGDNEPEGSPFKVKVHPGEWGHLFFQVKFNETLSDGQWEDLASVLRGWFLCGFWGGYGGYLHSLEELAYGGRSAKCYLDLGTAEVEAVHTLLRVLVTFHDESTEVEKVTFGEAPTVV